MKRWNSSSVVSVAALIALALVLLAGCGSVAHVPGEDNVGAVSDGSVWLRYKNGQCWTESTQKRNFKEWILGKAPRIKRTKAVCYEMGIVLTPSEAFRYFSQ